MTGLTKATHFAQRHGIDLARFADVPNAGPMASDVRDVARRAVERVADIDRSSRS